MNLLYTVAFLLQVAVLELTACLACKECGHCSVLNAGFILSFLCWFILTVLTQSRWYTPTALHDEGTFESGTWEDDEADSDDTLDSVDGQRKLARVLTGDKTDKGYGRSRLKRTGRHPGRETLRRHPKHIVNQGVPRPSLHDVSPKPPDFFGSCSEERDETEAIKQDAVN